AQRRAAAEPGRRLRAAGGDDATQRRCRGVRGAARGDAGRLPGPDGATDRRRAANTGARRAAGDLARDGAVAMAGARSAAAAALLVAACGPVPHSGVSAGARPPAVPLLDGIAAPDV